MAHYNRKLTSSTVFTTYTQTSSSGDVNIWLNLNTPRQIFNGIPAYSQINTSNSKLYVQVANDYSMVGGTNVRSYLHDGLNGEQKAKVHTEDYINGKGGYNSKESSVTWTMTMSGTLANLVYTNGVNVGSSTIGTSPYVRIHNDHSTFIKKYWCARAYIYLDYNTPVAIITANSNNSSYGTVTGGGTYEYDQTINLTATPNAGYQFNKWSGNSTSTSNSLSFSATSVINAYEASKTYTANFSPINYSISYNLNNGTISTPNPTSYTIETNTFTLNNPTRQGYKFLGWTGSNGTTPSTKVTIVKGTTGALSYTAHWEKIYITYDTIFSFQKWKDVGITGNSGTITNISNIGFTLTANSSAGEATTTSPYFKVDPGQSYKIDIDLEGNNWDVYIFFCDENGTQIDFSDSTNRFSSNGGGVSSRIFTAPNKDTVVKAQIRVDANGGNTITSAQNFRIYPANYSYMSTTVSAEDRTDVISWSIPTPSRMGYTFKNWNDKIDGTGGSYTANVTFPSDNKILYSQWTANSYQIEFNGNGATDGGMSLQSFKYDEKKSLTKNTFLRTGYEFIGWKDENGNFYADEEEIQNLTAENNKIIKLIAQWKFTPQGEILIDTNLVKKILVNTNEVYQIYKDKTLQYIRERI